VSSPPLDQQELAAMEHRCLTRSSWSSPEEPDKVELTWRGLPEMSSATSHSLDL